MPSPGNCVKGATTSGTGTFLVLRASGATYATTIALNNMCPGLNRPNAWDKEAMMIDRLESEVADVGNSCHSNPAVRSGSCDR